MNRCPAGHELLFTIIYPVERGLPSGVTWTYTGGSQRQSVGATTRTKRRVVLTMQRTSCRRFAMTLVLAIASVLLAACSNGQGSANTSAQGSNADTAVKHHTSRVALFGDSLAWEAQPYWTALIHKDNDAALAFTFGGTAPCDWIHEMREVASRYHLKAVELEFAGDNLTPCMKRYGLYSKAYYDKYRADMRTAIGIFTAGRTHVYLIGAPILEKEESVPNWRMLNAIYATIAQADTARVTYVNAGAAVEGPNGTFVETLPCLEGEPCTGPTVDGIPSNVIRSPDGTHFCPTATGNAHGVIGGCSVYSSGAYRFAAAMAAPLSTPKGRRITG